MRNAKFFVFDTIFVAHLNQFSRFAEFFRKIAFEWNFLNRLKLHNFYFPLARANRFSCFFAGSCYTFDMTPRQRKITHDQF